MCLEAVVRQGVIVLLLCLLWSSSPGTACPGGCSCVVARRGETASGKVVRCQTLSQIRMETMPVDTIILDMSGHSLTELPRDAFHNLTQLERLDLNDNQIQQIEAGAFSGLPHLTRLNLSGNALVDINGSMLEGMPSLTKLSLSRNRLRTIPDGSFANLPALERVDFASPYLVCDCHLSWLPRWRRKSERQPRISNSTVCASPMELRDRLVKRLKRKDLHCDWPLNLKVFEIQPARGQIVFQGDSLPLLCRASLIDPSHQLITWVRGDTVISSNTSNGVIIEQQELSDQVVQTRLLLSNLSPHQSGVWRCVVHTKQGNDSRAVSVVVMSNDTIYCPSVVTRNNKGVYRWPRTVSGVSQWMTCRAGAASGFTGGEARAYYQCDSQGVWRELNTEQCQYSSNKTRLLEKYAKGDLDNSTFVMSGADQLSGFMSGEDASTDMMDVVFMSEILESFSRKISANEQLANVILHGVSTMMEVDEAILAQAQRDYHACSKLVRAAEAIPTQLLATKKSVRRYSKHIAIEGHQVRPENFMGMLCGVRRSPESLRAGVYLDDSFSCTTVDPDRTVNKSAKAAQDKALEASIHMPADIFRHTRCLYPYCAEGDNFKLVFIVYKSAKLFPHLVSENRPQAVHTSVIASKIVGATVDNTSAPIVIRLKTREPGVNVKPVYWDTQANGELGGWSSHGCNLVKTEDSSTRVDTGTIVTFHASHLTNFALLQSEVPPLSALQSWLAACFNMSPAVYAGTTILVFCTMATTITYISAHRQLRMPRKAKHGVGNLSASMLLLCVTYTLGVRAKEPVVACQIIGLGLHYFSMCTIIWSIILSFVLCKKLSSVVNPPPPSDDGGPPMPPRSPLTCYLLGWGVAVIICGMSGAINRKNYAANPKFCFLSLDKAVLTFFIPVAILVFINCLIFIRIACIIHGAANKLFAEPIDDPDTEEVHVNELGGDFIAGGTASTQEDMSLAPTTTATSAALAPVLRTLDLEYRPVVQLRALAVLLLLYLLTWTSGAFTVALPFGDSIPHQEIIFNYLYGFTSAALGLFLLIYYCLGRKDARICWRQCFCCEKSVLDDDDDDEDDDDGDDDDEDNDDHEDQSRIMTSHHHTHHNHHYMPARLNGHLHSSSSLENSSFKSASFKYPPSVPSNTHTAAMLPSLTPNTHDISFSSGVEYPCFYNPRQNGIAKKYWEKHKKRNRLNRLNQELNNQNNDSGNNSQGENHRTVPPDTGADNNKRQSYNGGNSSDGGNMHFSVEIQIQPKPHTASMASTEQAQNLYNSLQRRHQQQILHRNTPPRTLGPSDIPQFLPVTALDRSKISPVGGPITPNALDAPRLLATFDQPAVSPNSSVVTGYPPVGSIPGESMCSFDSGANTGKRPQNHVVNEYMLRNGSVHRTRDFDGQSAVSVDPAVISPLSHLPIYTPPYAVSHTDDCTPASPDAEPSQPAAHNVCQIDSTPIPLTNTTTSSSGRKRGDVHSDFMDQLELRIPSSNLNTDSHSPSHVSTSTEQLKSSSHRNRHRHHNNTERPPSQGHSSTGSQERLPDDPSHDSLARSKHSISRSDRSVSPHADASQRSSPHQDEQQQLLDPSVATATEEGSSEGSETSGTEESGDEVWIPQPGQSKRKKKKKFKKETSV